VGYGAGMFDFEGSPTFTDCTFSSNTTTGASAYGAAVLDEYASPSFTGCTFSNNLDNGQDNEGGAIYAFNSVETLTNCIFNNNAANNPGYGGAILDNASSPILTNCVFNGNSAQTTNPFSSGWGGAIFNYSSSSPIITNCTFGNNVAGLAGAIMNFASSGTTLTNSILWNNTDDFGYEIFVNGDGSTVNVSYSDVQNGYAGTANLNVNPLFVNATSNLALQPDSPCINVGNNSDIQATGVTTDVLGNPRIVDGVVDLGAYEAQSVTVTWTGQGDGVNWGNPANWSDNLVPTQDDAVTIPSGVTVVEIGSGSFVAGSLNSASPIEIQSTGSLQMFGAAVITGTLTIDSGGTLDIQNHALTINYGTAAADPLTTIRGYLHSAFSNGSWTGTGLTSSEAQSNPTLFAIGYTDYTATDQLNYQLTTPGDASMDFTTNFNDLLVIAQNFGKTTARGNAVSWSTGDVNYDGNVNFNDLLIVAQHFGQTLAQSLAAAAAASQPVVVPPDPAPMSTPATLPAAAGLGGSNIIGEASMVGTLIRIAPPQTGATFTSHSSTSSATMPAAAPTAPDPTAPSITTEPPAAPVTLITSASSQPPAGDFAAAVAPAVASGIQTAPVTVKATTPHARQSNQQHKAAAVKPAVHVTAKTKEPVVAVPALMPRDAIVNDTLVGVWSGISTGSDSPFADGRRDRVGRIEQ
jgi:hypothetical protein